jgi:hypothetical protein
MSLSFMELFVRSTNRMDSDGLAVVSKPSGRTSAEGLKEENQMFES